MLRSTTYEKLGALLCSDGRVMHYCKRDGDFAQSDRLTSFRHWFDKSRISATPEGLKKFDDFPCSGRNAPKVLLTSDYCLQLQLWYHSNFPKAIT